MNEELHFQYSLAHNESDISWDDWLELYEAERSENLGAVLRWIMNHRREVMVASTYPVKSLLLDIALAFLVDIETEDRDARYAAMERHHEQELLNG